MNELFESFVTWQSLTGFGGCLAMVILLTQFTKAFRIPTQLLSYIWAVLILLLGTAFTSGLDVESAALSLFNAVIISIASNGGYEVITKIFEKKST